MNPISKSTIRLAIALAATLFGVRLAAAEDPNTFPPSPTPPPSAQSPDTSGPSAKPAPPDNAAGAAAGSQGEPPPPPDTPEIRAEILKGLYTHLAQAKDPDTAAAIAGQIERMWFVSGSDTIDLLMQRALKAMGEQNLDLSLKLLTAVTELQPDYAEAWNRRALIYFKMNDTERSLGDLRRTLALEPKHYKALEGVANVLRDAGNKKAALEALRKATEIHPQLPGVADQIEELTREVEGQGI